MRFAERIRHLGLFAMLCMVAAGCATKPPVQPEVAPPAQTSERGSATPSAASASAGATSATSTAPTDEVPVDVRLAYERAVAALAAGRNEEAERDFLALTKSNPEFGGPFANLGLIYRRAGRTEQAAVQLEQAVQASPRQPVYLNQLGIAYRELGRFADAQRAYEKAIEIAPGYAAPQLNLGILFDLYLWDSRSALAAYERYLGLAPEGDEKVRKWVAEIRSRKPQAQLVGMRERP